MQFLSQDSNKTKRPESLIFTFKRYFLWEIARASVIEVPTQNFIYLLPLYDINLELYRRSIVYSHIIYAIFYCPIYLGFSIKFIGILSGRANIF